MADSSNQVICVDNFQTGCRGNVVHWLNSPRFDLVRHDVVEPLRLEVDRIWHLACPSSPRHYQRNPIATAKTGVIGTLNMLGLAKRCGARLLFASASEVYGDPLVSPQVETDFGHGTCMGPLACYEQSKRMGETLCFDYARVHGVSIGVARIFNTYGPRMSLSCGSVISTFITQALHGQPLTIHGNGDQTRSFCYCSDLVKGLELLMDSEVQGPVNLGSPDEITIRDLAGCISDLVNPALQVVHQPLLVDDPQRRCPAIERAELLLGWRPVVELQQGLQATIDDLSGQLQQSSLQSL